jgi:hypothetical protein
MQFAFDTQDEYVPPVHPPGEDRSPRRHATTQVLVRVVEWPGDTFRLWLPEHVVPELWSNMRADQAPQCFASTERGGLFWAYQDNPDARIEAELIPLQDSLLLEVQITNASAGAIEGVQVMNCLQLSQAPDFACDDLSRLYVRSQGQWLSLSERTPKSAYPTYYRAGYLEGGGVGIWGGKLDVLTEPARVDHPLMVCVAKGGQRAVGTASENCYMLFHNQANRNLLCIHSNQEPLPLLMSGETVVFRQKIYFVEGGLMDCVAAFEADPL